MTNENIYKLALQINLSFDGHIANALVIDGGMILTICGKSIRLTDTFDIMPVKGCGDMSRPDWRGTTCGATFHEDPHNK